MNPIFRREFLARWRDWRSHLLLLGLALLLSLTAFLVYRFALQDAPMNYRVYPPRPIVESLATRASRAGHTLFTWLACGNVAVWFLLAPLLCATGIARERERGLLEGLQLSPMSPRSQVWARALSAMLYLAALQLVTLPIYFVAFSFGGVSEGEIGRAWLVVAATAWCGVGLGLSLSAAAYRPSGALFGAVALVFGWTVAAVLGFSGMAGPWGMLSLGVWTRPLAFVLFCSHPAMVAGAVCDSTFAGYFSVVSPTSYGPPFWTFDRVFPLCVAGCFAAGALGLWKTTREVTRAFEPSGWAGRNPLVEGWKKRRAARLESRRARARTRMSVEGALLADLPFDKWIRFKNPLLNREVRSRFRLRRTSAPLWFGRGVLALLAASAWLRAVDALLDPPGRVAGAAFLLWTEWLLGAALVGTWAASGYAREREAGTWEGLRLSLLGSGAIARTKWASPLLAFALLTIPLWGLLLAFAHVGNWSGVPIAVLLAGALVVATSLGVISALGNWVSLRARNTTTATCWTLGLLLGGFAIAPPLLDEVGVSDWCVRHITGVPRPSDYVGSGQDYQWRQFPEVLARYEWETGSKAPPLQPPHPLTHAGILSFAEKNKRFSAWCETKGAQVADVGVSLKAWNPLSVLYRFENQPDKDDDYVRLALTHAVLCAVAIALLLGSTVRRLKGRLD